jgi:hypothetical protein
LPGAGERGTPEEGLNSFTMPSGDDGDRYLAIEYL